VDQEVVVKTTGFFSHVNLLKELKFHPKDWHNFLRMNESTYLKFIINNTEISVNTTIIMQVKITTTCFDPWGSSSGRA